MKNTKNNYITCLAKYVQYWHNLIARTAKFGDFFGRPNLHYKLLQISDCRVMGHAIRVQQSFFLALIF